MWLRWTSELEVDQVLEETEIICLLLDRIVYYRFEVYSLFIANCFNIFLVELECQLTSKIIKTSIFFCWKVWYEHHVLFLNPKKFIWIMSIMCRWWGSCTRTNPDDFFLPKRNITNWEDDCDTQNSDAFAMKVFFYTKDWNNLTRIPFLTVTPPSILYTSSVFH